jgi:hypothetical protein
MPFALLLLLALPALWPLWRVGLPGTADGTLHLLRIALLDYHVSQGMLFPRWMPELVLGYGYPLLNFYGPTTYYVAEGLHLLGLAHSTALLATLGLLILTGGYGALLLARDMFADLKNPVFVKNRVFELAVDAPALVAAVAYLYTPYLLTNVYMRGALAEVGAQALLPWIFWSFRRLLRAERPELYVLPAALSLGGLAATHNITLLWIPVTLLAYIGVLWWPVRGWRALLWPAAGGMAAVGVSAFFWAPLILERGYLSGVAFDIAATYMGENVWTWRNFLDWHLPFDYTLSIPFQIGALQLALAIAGFVLIRPKTGEWWYWAIVALLGMAGISSLALPLWMNNELLLIAQFPWRLLSIVSLPLALMTGGLLTRLRATPLLTGATLALLALIILSERPQAQMLTTLIRAPRDLTPAEVAQFELDTNAYGTSSSSEFLPRWAGDGVFAPQPPAESQPPVPAVRLDRASPFRLELLVDAVQAGPLHFATFYFPGWQATLDGAPVAAYPEPARGLLTVDVPAGVSGLTLVWTGTRVQRTANLVSLLTLAGLLALALWLERRRPARALLWAAAPGLLLLWGMLAVRPPPAAQPVAQPAALLATDGMSLLGTRTLVQDDGYVMVYPTWLVAAITDDLRVAWDLVDAAGSRYPLAESGPFFNTLATANWSSGSVVDDAYRLALPPDLPAGTYQLEANLVGPSGATAPVTVADLALKGTPPSDAAPALALGWRFGDHARLAGVDFSVNGRPVVLGDAMPPVVRPGDRLTYRLAWLGDGAVPENYHAFLHLLNVAEAPLLQGDQLPGPVFSPPRLWNPYRAAPDVYRFTVPEDAPSGLYRGAVGLYRFAAGERLSVTTDDGTPLGDRGLLPPVKIVNSPPGRPETLVEATFGDFATLEGYTLAPASAAVRPGETFTVTLQYDVRGPAPADLTQFVHVYDPALGMAAQRDARPGSGGNPTNVWVAGETVVETVPLTMAADAPPGAYDLLVGFYDAQAGAVRVPVTDAAGARVMNDQLPLVRITVR